MRHRPAHVGRTPAPQPQGRRRPRAPSAGGPVTGARLGADLRRAERRAEPGAP